MTQKKGNTGIKKIVLHEDNENLYPDDEKTLLKDCPKQPDHSGAKVDFTLVKSFWDEKEGKTRKKLGILSILILLLFFLIFLSIRYLQKPEPLPAMLPAAINMNYPPHYLFSIYGISQPIGVAVSPDGNLIYATETGGENIVRLFDRDGNEIESFYAPFLQPGERSPVYIEVAPDSNVYVTDRLQHSVFIFNSEGKYLDALISPGLTISEYVGKHAVEPQLPGSEVSYSRFHEWVTYTQQDGKVAQLPLPDIFEWAPLGITITAEGTLLLTDVIDEDHSVIELDLPANWIPGVSTGDFNPSIQSFGEYGQGNGQFIFPNLAVEDSQSRIYVSDGNNSRVSIWDKEWNFLYNIGRGTGKAALDLPRGLVVDQQDRLFIIDAVNQSVKVFDVSGNEPVFLYAFGVSGTGDGQFNYPNDIAIDRTGRLYIADRENSRIQVWSY